MPKVILTTQVQDPVKWESKFKTHGDLLRTYGLGVPVHYGISGNEVTICMEPENLDDFMRVVLAPPTINAMKSDGVEPATVKLVVLDKEFKF